MTVEQGIGIGLVVLALIVFFLVRHRLRAEEQRWNEHPGRREQTDGERSLSERRW